jgi:hypothetical protein
VPSPSGLHKSRTFRTTSRRSKSEGPSIIKTRARSRWFGKRSRNLGDGGGGERTFYTPIDVEDPLDKSCSGRGFKIPLFWALCCGGLRGVTRTVGGTVLSVFACSRLLLDGTGGVRVVRGVEIS